MVGAEVLCLSPQAEFNNLRNDPDTLYISLALSHALSEPLKSLYSSTELYRALQHCGGSTTIQHYSALQYTSSTKTLCALD